MTPHTSSTAKQCMQYSQHTTYASASRDPALSSEIKVLGRRGSHRSISSTNSKSTRFHNTSNLAPSLNSGRFCLGAINSHRDFCHTEPRRAPLRARQQSSRRQQVQQRSAQSRTTSTAPWTQHKTAFNNINPLCRPPTWMPPQTGCRRCASRACLYALTGHEGALVCVYCAMTRQWRLVAAPRVQHSLVLSPASAYAARGGGCGLLDDKSADVVAKGETHF